MKYPVRRFKSLELALKEMEPYVRDGAHLQTGKPFKQLGVTRDFIAPIGGVFNVVVALVEGGDAVFRLAQPVPMPRQASMMYLRVSARLNRDPRAAANSNTPSPSLALPFSTAFRATLSSFSGETLSAPASTARCSSASS
jgi:hypothetical protein